MPETAVQASPGSLMLGRYRPVRPLGSGGSGSVWLVRDEKNVRDVALKMVRREGTLGPRAEREAAAAARLRHERCLRAYALARDSGHVYIAYEYVVGKTFREALRAKALSDADVVEAAAQVLDGLAHAHAHGVVHRDVKPANVLLAEGPEVSVKLLDFGLALMREEETLTAAGDIPGTLAYISPERLRGQQAGPAADVWSVGVLLWEGLAGRHPFWGGTLVETARAIQAGAPSLGETRPDLPKQLVALVNRMLATNPAKRPRASRLAGDLRRAYAARPASRPTSIHDRRGFGARNLRRVPPALAPALFAGWASHAMPFYPTAWPLLLASCVFAIAYLRPRAGLALALAVPVFPLGNHAFGLAVLYTFIALAWLAISWRDARSGLLCTAGPLLAPIGALGFLPLVVQPAKGSARRAVQAMAAVLVAGAATGSAHVGRLGIAETRSPLTSAGALWRVLLDHPAYPLQALAFGCAAALLPLARTRGPWAIAALGALVLALTLAPTRATQPLPIVLTTAAMCALLACEPWLRTWVSERLVPGTVAAEA
jgi:hypothetical protein